MQATRLLCIFLLSHCCTCVLQCEKKSCLLSQSPSGGASSARLTSACLLLWSKHHRWYSLCVSTHSKHNMKGCHIALYAHPLCFNTLLALPLEAISLGCSALVCVSRRRAAACQEFLLAAWNMQRRIEGMSQTQMERGFYIRAVLL